VVVGWGLLNDGWKPAWILSFTSQYAVLFPRLFPRFDIATPLFRAFRALQALRPATSPATKKTSACCWDASSKPAPRPGWSARYRRAPVQALAHGQLHRPAVHQGRHHRRKKARAVAGLGLSSSLKVSPKMDLSPMAGVMPVQVSGRVLIGNPQRRASATAQAVLSPAPGGNANHTFSVVQVVGRRQFAPGVRVTLL
jgi:hypothetical protein